MKVKNFDLLSLERPFLIAEAGSSHLGNPEIALQMAHAAAKSGADALTFQEIDETCLYSKMDSLPVAQQPKVGWDCLRECQQIANKAGLCFSVCVTDKNSLDYALKIGIDFIKIVSYDITFIPFLEICGKTGLPIFMSTGASTFKEIEIALNALNSNDRVLLYHTDCGYPTKDNEVNLLRMIALKEKFGLPVGYCDHTDHDLSCLAATALKANAIEKHFILDKSSGGSDHMVALEPDELIRAFSKIKRVAAILGNGDDKIENGDLFRRNNLRRSVALCKDKRVGEKISYNDITMLRPPIGIDWEDAEKIIGLPLRKDIPNRTILKFEDFE